MDDNSVKEAVCPIRGFGPTEYNVPSTDLFAPVSQSQSQNDGKNEFFSSKEPANYSLPNLSMMMPKQYDESQDTETQDQTASQDLHNGHNIQNDEKIVQRTLSMGELEPAVDGEPDTMPVDGKVNEAGNGETQVKDNLEKPSINENHEKMELDFSSLKKNVPENMEKEKSLTDEGSQSQDMFRSLVPEGNKKLTKMDVSETEGNAMDLKKSEGLTDDSEGFDLHLSQTQSFMFPVEKSKSPMNCESDESKPSEEQIGNKVDESDDRSNESSIKRAESFDEQSNESEIKKSNDFDDRSNESEFKKVESCDEQSNESESKKVDNFEDGSNESDVKKAESCDDQSSLSDWEMKKVESSEDQSNQSETKKVQNSDEQSNDSEMKELESSNEPDLKKINTTKESEVNKIEISDESVIKKFHNSDEKPSKECIGKKVDGSSDDKSNDVSANSIVDSCENKKNESTNKEIESMEVDSPVDLVETPTASGDKGEKSDKTTPKKQVTFEDQMQSTERDVAVEESTNNIQAGCSCMPACHDRMESISMHLNSACVQLEEFIKSKKRDDKKLLNNFLDMLKEIQSISENNDVPDDTKISESVFSLEETPKSGRKTATKRKSTDDETPQKATPRKKVAEEKAGKPSEKKTIDFKDLKGLAVFAKWPNSGWYYPGIVEELTAADWKEVSNVTVKFYDGLVRDMKNINILPAYLIPTGSMLCDLEDETEMMVLSCEGSNQNSVDFKLSTKENPDTVLELNFNKLAIKANHMKNIKVQLEPTTDATPKNLHVVSLVSGRRSSRGRTKKEEESEEKTEEKPKVERRTITPKKAPTPRRTRN